MLNGANGILPIKDYLSRVHSSYEALAYQMLPTIFWINSSDAMIVGVCIAGIVLSVMVVLGIMTAPSLVALAFLYMSFNNACGEFMAFQSDSLIIEATACALFMVPWCWVETPMGKGEASSSEPSLLALLPTRFLLFRLMFAAGLVKLLSGDPHWQDLTAMSYHHETQPIPTPLAWFLHHLPMWAHQSATIFTFIAELIVPPLYFFGRTPRLIAAVVTTMLHLGIIASGNYTFLNYLTIAMCIPLVDDSIWLKVFPIVLMDKLRSSLKGVAKFGPRFIETKTVVLTAASSIFLVIGLGQFLEGLGMECILPGPWTALLSTLAPYRIFNSYGMFAVMTTSRPEIVFEGSDDGKDWKEYVFKYKVDDPYKAPPIIAPHTPRLDWRLWFAAMRNSDENPYVFSIARLLLKGDPTLLHAFRRVPFAEKPPRFVRALVYDYHFSDSADLFSNSQWWRRGNMREFLPPFELSDDGQLKSANI